MIQAVRNSGFTPLSAPRQNPFGAAAPGQKAVQTPSAQSAAVGDQGPVNDSRRLKIAVIDNFNPDSDPLYQGFGSHGDYISNQIRSGGADPRLAGRIDLLQYDAGTPGQGAGDTSTEKIKNALMDVYNRAQNGEDIDAVNLSQASFGESQNNAEIRQLLEDLRGMNIPVSVAAGNSGAQEQNFMASNGQFEVEAARNGQRVERSGLGNIQEEGEYTSFAAADLTPLLAARNDQGLSIDEMKAEAAANGGTLTGGGGQMVSFDRGLDQSLAFSQTGMGRGNCMQPPCAGQMQSSMSMQDLIGHFSSLMEQCMQMLCRRPRPAFA